MSSNLFVSERRSRVRFAFLVASSLAAGCATGRVPIVTASDAAPPAELSLAEETPVLRSGRYTLVELVPEHAQRDLMEQIIDVTIPATMTPTVGEALRFVLLRTGYRLCEWHEETRALDALPLPAAHLRLGPLTLREALNVLVGPTRELQVDETTRHVCIQLRDSSGSTHAIAIPSV